MIAMMYNKDIAYVIENMDTQRASVVGRLSPSIFLLTWVCSAVIYICGMMLALYSGLSEGAANIFVLILAVLWGPWMFILYIARLHDAGYSGWWSPLAVFTSLLGLIAVAATGGEKIANKYGDVPTGSLKDLRSIWKR